MNFSRMTHLSYVQCWQCQIMCRFCCFVVNIQGTRYSLPERHRRSFQNLPYTMDPKYPVPIPHRKVASLLSPDCRQNAFGQHSRSVFLVFGSKSVYLINNKHFWVPLFPFLAIIFASFFRFMQANVSPTFISIRAFPIICV